ICNARGRRRPPSDNEESVTNTDEAGSSLASMTGFQLGPKPQGSLLGPLQPSMAPMPVYAGLPKNPPAGNNTGVELASGPRAKKNAAKNTAPQEGADSKRQAVIITTTPKEGAKPAAPKAAPKNPAPKNAAPKTTAPKTAATTAPKPAAEGAKPKA